MKFKRKGEYGYIRSEKLRRLLITGALFAIPIVILLTGMYINGTKKSILTVVAMVGCLPACKSAVGMIVMMLRRPMPSSLYDTIRPHEGSLTMCYDMYLTSYDKSCMLDACAICGNTIVGFCSDERTDTKFLETHITKTLRADGQTASVRILQDVGLFTERMDSMNEHEDSLRHGITYRPNPLYPEFGPEELIRQSLLNVSL